MGRLDLQNQDDSFVNLARKIVYSYIKRHDPTVRGPLAKPFLLADVELWLYWPSPDRWSCVFTTQLGDGKIFIIEYVESTRLYNFVMYSIERQKTMTTEQMQEQLIEE